MNIKLKNRRPRRILNPFDLVLKHGACISRLATLEYLLSPKRVLISSGTLPNHNKETRSVRRSPSPIM